MNYEKPGTLPLFIKRVVEQEDTPEGAIERITSALPYWSLKALREGAEADRREFKDKNYQDKLAELIQYTERQEHGERIGN